MSESKTPIKDYLDALPEGAKAALRKFSTEQFRAEPGVLAGRNLVGASLQEVDLRGLDLRRANLRGAKMTCADFRGADLRGANFRGANLSHAELEGLCLQGAGLSGAILRCANLKGACLMDASLCGADLCGADLGGTNLWGADLRGVDLRGACLRGARRSRVYVEKPGGCQKSTCKALVGCPGAASGPPLLDQRTARHMEIKIEINVCAACQGLIHGDIKYSIPVEEEASEHYLCNSCGAGTVPSLNDLAEHIAAPPMAPDHGCWLAVDYVRRRSRVWSIFGGKRLRLRQGLLAQGDFLGSRGLPYDMGVLQRLTLSVSINPMTGVVVYGVRSRDHYDDVDPHDDTRVKR